MRAFLLLIVVSLGVSALPDQRLSRLQRMLQQLRQALYLADSKALREAKGMFCLDATNPSNSCCLKRDAADAREASAELGRPRLPQAKHGAPKAVPSFPFRLPPETPGPS